MPASPWTLMGQEPADPQPSVPQVIQIPGSQPIVMMPVNRTKTNTQVGTTLSKAVPLSQDEARGLGDTRDMLVRDYLKSYRDQASGVEEQQDRLGAVERALPTGLDLSPLMALADAWGAHKSNLAGAYKAPMSPAEKAVLLQKLDSQVQGQRAKLTTSDLAILRTLLPAGNTLATKDTQAIDSQTGVQPIAAKGSPQPRAAPRPLAGQLPDPKGFMRDFDKEVKSQKSAKEAADMVNTAYASGSKVAPAAAQSLITIASGESSRHAASIEAKFQGDPSFMSTIRRAWQKAADGTLTDHDTAEMSALAKAYSGAHQNIINEIYDDYTGNRYPGYRLGQDEARGYLKRFARPPQVAAPAEQGFSLKDIIQGYMKKGGK